MGSMLFYRTAGVHSCIFHNLLSNGSFPDVGTADFLPGCLVALRKTDGDTGVNLESLASQANRRN